MELNGRQVGDIRKDHLERYHFAASRFRNMEIIDAACGIGYGSKILARTNNYVHAYDIDPDALALARVHYAHSGIQYYNEDLRHAEFVPAQGAVSFETIEHLEDPRPFLCALRECSKRLIASVPNESVLPFHPLRHLYHHKHYTPDEFVELLHSCGWNVLTVQHQKGKTSSVGDCSNGQTIIVEADIW